MASRWLLLGACADLLHAASASQTPLSDTTDSCSAPRFSGISIPDGEVLDLTAKTVTDYQIANSTIDFCNVTVTYTHGWNDTIHSMFYLPLSNWNGRFQGVGGGGWAASQGPESLLEPVLNGYAAGNTDAGHELNILSTESWFLDAQGKLNIPLLKDFASVALNDLGVIGKQVSHIFYGVEPHHSYWSGCSTGGRQGYMLAQRYPTTFDGIFAAAPAINWDRFIIAEYWPQFVMNSLGHYPEACVLAGITAAAVEACDGELDGVDDGVISYPEVCDFDTASVVGRQLDCGSSITDLDAELVKRIWEGPRTSNGSLWYGLEKGTDLTGLGGTSCSSPTDCTGQPFAISYDYITRWVLQNPDADLTGITLDEYVELFHSSSKQYNHIIGTSNPDLSAFKEAGGKLLTWHGVADPLIFPKGTEDYYTRVESQDPNVRDFYRLFEAPGVGHCAGGVGEVPVDPLQAVVAWVENGTAPETLLARSDDGQRTRELCLWPLISVYEGGDPTKPESFVCEEGFS
ncbi:Tannase/feruloyl esterase [Aspergillus unguis]